MICIICRKDKQDMSDEHVIPDSLGGAYHLFNVCKVCNSKMGEKVDAPLVNHKLTDLYRLSQDMAGKSGKVPNPFSGMFFAEEDPTAKARVNLNEDGRLEVEFHPIVKLKEEAGKVQSIEITVDSKNEAEIDDILKKILKRKGIPETAIIKGESRREIRTGGVGTLWEMDLLKFKIGLLKIAYEFAVDSVPAYFATPDAVCVSEILERADYERASEYAKIGSGLKHEIFEPFARYLDLSSKKHYLILTQTDFGLLALIKLHDLFAVGFLLSEDRLLGSGEIIIGVNDIDGRGFRKALMADVINECMGPLHTRFCYHLVGEREETEGRAEIQSDGYRYEGQGEHRVPIYKRNGARYPLFVDQILETASFEDLWDGTWHIQRYWFDQSQEYFVRSVGSGNLYRVIGLEMSRELLRKA